MSTIQPENFFERVTLPVRGFNLWSYLSQRNPMDWDFANIRETLDRLEADVQAVKDGKSITL